jgi:hypothetical protein
MYATRGSGISVNIKNTIVFNSHKEAAMYINVACSDKWCTNAFPNFSKEFKKRGYDSIQFVNGEGAHRCHHVRAIEILLLNISGTASNPCSDSISYRSGKDHPCHCQNYFGCAACLK